MRALIPSGVFTAIEEQYRQARPVTRGDYEGGAEEEDAITGAMMKGLREAVHGERDGFVWHTKVFKLRGRGAGAEEKRTGADVIVEIEVRDADGDVVAQKGLLGQAKTDWGSRDARLVEQSRKMEELAAGASVVIDYTREGATACRASQAVQADGRRRDLPEGSLKPLGELLADDFLPCSVGRQGMSYDRTRRQIIFASPTGIMRLGYPAAYQLLTTVEPSSRTSRRRAGQRPFEHGQLVRPVDLVRDRSGVMGLFGPESLMTVDEQRADGYVRVCIGMDRRVDPPVPVFVDVHPDDIELA